MAGVLTAAGAALLGVLAIGLGRVVDPGVGEYFGGGVSAPSDSGLTVGEVTAVAEGRGDRERFERAVLRFDARMPHEVGDLAPVMAAAVDPGGRGREWVEATGVRFSLGWPFTWASGLSWEASEMRPGTPVAAVPRPGDSADWSVGWQGVCMDRREGWRSRSGELSLTGGVIAAALFFGGLAAWRAPGRGRPMGLAALALVVMAAAPTWSSTPWAVGTFLWEEVPGVSPRSMRRLSHSDRGAAELASALLAAMNRVGRAEPHHVVLVRHSVGTNGVRALELGGVWLARVNEGGAAADGPGTAETFGGVQAFWGQVDPVIWAVRRGREPTDRRCLIVPLKNVTGVMALPAALWLGRRACRTRRAAGCVNCGYELAAK